METLSALDINFINLVYIRYAVTEKVVTYKKEFPRVFNPKYGLFPKDLREFRSSNIWLESEFLYRFLLVNVFSGMYCLGGVGFQKNIWKHSHRVLLILWCNVDLENFPSGSPGRFNGSYWMGISLTGPSAAKIPGMHKKQYCWLLLKGHLK